MNDSSSNISSPPGAKWMVHALAVTGIGARISVLLATSTAESSVAGWPSTAATRPSGENVTRSRVLVLPTTLCTARLAVEIGAADPTAFVIETDSGVVEARTRGDGFEIDLQPVSDVRAGFAAIPTEPGESRVGFATVGVPHAIYGEEVVSYVVARPGTAIDVAELLRYCGTALPAFKAPKEIVVSTALPKTERGKLDRKALVQFWCRGGGS